MSQGCSSAVLTLRVCVEDTTEEESATVSVCADTQKPSGCLTLRDESEFMPNQP